MITAELKKADTDDPWAVSEAEFPYHGTAVQRLRFALKYAILAPSNYNSQPWLFRIVGDDVEVYADRRRGLAVIDPDDRELLMSCGAAIYNLRVAIRHFGAEPIVRLFPDLDDPDLLAFVRMGAPVEADAKVDALFRAILSRRTNRLELERRPLPEGFIAELSRAVEELGAYLHPISDASTRSRIADLVEKGVLAMGSDKHYRRELAAWMHPNRTSSRDGIPGHAQGLGEIRSIAEPLILRATDWGPERGAQLKKVVMEAPAIVVLTTASDSSHAWVEAGQALERILLATAAEGMGASFVNHAIQINGLRTELAAAIGAPDEYPQTMLRIGYGRPMRPTPRRPLAEVMASNKYI